MDLTNLLNRIGIHSESLISFLNVLLDIIILSIIAAIVYIIARKFLPWIAGKITKHTHYKWDELLFDKLFFKRLGGVLVPSILRIGLSSVEWKHMTFINNILEAWIVVAIILLILAVMKGVNRVYDNIAVRKEGTVRVFTQVLTIIFWAAAALSIISIFTGKSIAGLLGGLAAFAAVLMLVFQDTILGFVAGIQLSSNNMVRIGDWIVMPSRGVDGDVIDISLTTVKVQNWDKTITTIPTHRLVQESFTNWRGMEESKGRRIKRSVNIDIASIHYLSEQELENLKKSSLLKDYIEGKIKEISKFNENRETILDERRLTNVGTFREYLEIWLTNNPNINQEMTHMVRQLQPGPTGLPIEIYCFSAKQSWVDYENVQSDIFDHLYAVMPLFNLKSFQYTGVVPIGEE